MSTVDSRGPQINLGFDPGSAYSLNRLSAGASTSTPNSTGFQNGAYDENTVDDFSDPYSFIPEQEPSDKGRGVRSPPAAPQPRTFEHNDGYEMPIELIQHCQETQTRQKRREVAEPIRRPKRLFDSWLNRVIVFFIMLLSVVAILLVLLLMLGKVGVNCSSCYDRVIEPSREAQTSDQSAAVVDLSSLKEITQEMEAQYNATLNHVEANERRLEDIKEAVETNHTELRDALSKLNSTTQQNSLAIFFSLSELSRTFAVQVQTKESQQTKAREDIQDNMIQMNSTLSARLQSKLEEPGPQGPQGRNGSQGSQGPVGVQGNNGPEGHNGTQGQKGPPGAVGERGPNGANGTEGERGIKGLLGDKGNNGSVGDSGPVGAEGLTGVGNFSWCEQLTENSTVSDVQVVETNDDRIFWVQCSTELGNEAESRLVAAGTPGLQQYTCSCKDSAGQSTSCKLHYWNCPIAAAP